MTPRALMTIGALAAVLLGAAACRQTEVAERYPERQAVVENRQAGWLLSRDGLGPVRFCAPLDTINVIFDDVRDTVFAYGDDSWPGKLVPSRRLSFVASWADPTRIWTIAAETPDVQSATGVKVGDEIAGLLERGEQLVAMEHEGQLVLQLASGVSLLVDSASEDAYFSRPATDVVPSLDAVPRRARVRELFVSRECGTPPAR
jgi:hypothetical protein